MAKFCNSNITACQDDCDQAVGTCKSDCSDDQYWCQIGCGNTQQCMSYCSGQFTQCETNCDVNRTNCLQQCNPNSCYWYQVPVSEDEHLNPGTQCLVKMNVNSSNQMICDDTLANSGAQWFKGTIQKDKDYNGGSNKVKICSVAGCTKTVNPNKCRYYNGNWTGFCYVHKTW